MTRLFFTIFAVIIFGISVCFWYFKPSLFDAPVAVLSPIPTFLTREKNDQVTLLDFWKPFFKTNDQDVDPLAPTAKAALLYDLTTDKLLYGKHAADRVPMASLTKIMTAIIALENKRSDDRYIVHGADLVGEDSMGLEANEVLTLEELLYGLMLRSGNDAAEVLATNYENGRDAYVLAMNQKAQALGLIDTKFSNPSGLQGDGVQYTTASDLLVMTKYALENYPLFARIAATSSYVIPANGRHKEYVLENETNLLTTYPGVKGVKTGYTPEAGLCLVTYLEYEDHKIIGVLLGSENRRQEMKDMLDFGLRKLMITPPPHD